MAAEWEAAMGMDLGMGSHYHAAPPAASPADHHHGYYQPHHYYGAQGEPMRVDELLDLSHAGVHDFFPGAEQPAPPPASSSDHHHASSFNLNFSDEFYIPVPTEEAAELEWLSNFVDDSYPDVPSYPPAVQAAIAAAASNAHAAQQQENSASAAAPPGRGARSKRSRAASAAAAAWHALVPRQQPSPSSSSDLSNPKPARSGSGGKKGLGLGLEAAEAPRRCTHCASEKTPQWRTGPLGPKTLCNACGVRYKSGRLVPEYRPAASPTFVLTQHSNSHRKVMELRRQNETLQLEKGTETRRKQTAMVHSQFCSLEWYIRNWTSLGWYFDNCPKHLDFILIFYLEQTKVQHKGSISRLEIEVTRSHAKIQNSLTV